MDFRDIFLIVCGADKVGGICQVEEMEVLNEEQEDDHMFDEDCPDRNPDHYQSWEVLSQDQFDQFQVSREASTQKSTSSKKSSGSESSQ